MNILQRIYYSLYAAWNGRQVRHRRKQLARARAKLSPAQRDKLELVRKSFELDIRTRDDIPAFGAACIPDDPETDEPHIVLNLGACLLCHAQEDVDFKVVVLETLMHEYGHVLEHWLELEVDEARIEALVQMYREKHGGSAEVPAL